MRSEDPFANLIEEPLRAVIGSRLGSVAYWGLAMEGLPPCDPESPNECEIQAIALSLGSERLFAWPGWTPRLRTASRNSPLELTLGDRNNIEQKTDGYAKWDASLTTRWRQAMGSRLVSAAVWGVDRVPHALILAFDRMQIVISTGNADLDKKLMVGDGDDLLVLTREEFVGTPQDFGPPMERIWDIASPPFEPGRDSPVA